MLMGYKPIDIMPSASALSDQFLNSDFVHTNSSFYFLVLVIISVELRADGHQ